MSESSPIEVVHESGVARVWLDHPDVHNALSPALGAALTAALHELAQDDRVRVVVLGGRGPSFCAGADIHTMKHSAGASFEDNLAEARQLADMFAALANLPMPVVARIHGGVYGGGVGFCCACDIAVASDEARFGLTEVRLGIIPGLISPYVIRRLGERTARELMLTGERFGAADALRCGVVHHVVPTAGLDEKVDERVSELLKGGPTAQRTIKQLFQRWGDQPFDEYRSSLPETLAEVRSGDEARDGLGAFFDKRRPHWVP